MALDKVYIIREIAFLQIEVQQSCKVVVRIFVVSVRLFFVNLFPLGYPCKMVPESLRDEINVVFLGVLLELLLVIIRIFRSDGKNLLPDWTTVLVVLIRPVVETDGKIT